MAVSIGQLIAPAKKAMIVTGCMTTFGGIVSIVPYAALTHLGADWLAGRDASPWPWVIVAVVALVVSQLLYTAGLGLTHVAEAHLRNTLRHRLVHTFGRIPLGRVEQTSSGAIRKMVVDDTTSIHTLVAHVSGDTCYAFSSLIAGLVYLLWVSWALTLALFATWVIIVALVAGVMLLRFGDITKRFSDAQTRLSAATVEMTDAIQEIKNFQGGDATRTRFDEARRNFTKISFEWVTKSGSTMAFLYGFLHPGPIVATVAPLAILFVHLGWIQLAYTLPFFLIAIGIPAGLARLMELMQFIYEAHQAAQDTAGLLSTPPMPQGPNRPDDGPRPNSVELEHVTFGYDPAKPVLRDVSFSAPAGSVTALVGPSGGGKTTLARLLARFYDPDSGVVRIGGVDVRDVSFRWLLSRVAIVFQDIDLVNETVAHNIALGRPDATREQIQDAARAACIHERIMRLPDGYDTVIGSAAGNLSGGEKQRITIARAYLQDAPILILDEATAQADPQSERHIHAALTTLSRGRTVIIIAHRLATVASADNILVIDSGRIVERGRHSDLLAAAGAYARLWRAQQIDTPAE